jgi:hypothetical protein
MMAREANEMNAEGKGGGLIDGKFVREFPDPERWRHESVAISAIITALPMASAGRFSPLGPWGFRGSP